MIELYGMGPSRWVKCYWMLKELGVDFKECPVKLPEGEHKSPKFLALNPFGKIPVLRDGEITLFQSTAILNYLGDRYPQSDLVPKAGTADRAFYDQWTSYCTTELEQPLWRLLKHTRLFPEAQRIPQDVKLAKEEFAQTAKILDEQIGSRKFLVGNRFTAADITMAYTLGWAQMFELVGPYKNCLRYHQEMTTRPAFPRHLYAR